MKRMFAAIVERSAAWDQALPPPEQDGFAGHAAYMGSLEAEGFITLAGLMMPSTDVLFVFSADSEQDIRDRMAQDPWQRDGHTRLVRLEEMHVRERRSPAQGD